MQKVWKVWPTGILIVYLMKPEKRSQLVADLLDACPESAEAVAPGTPFESLLSA